jgi:hypothetical protein
MEGAIKMMTYVFSFINIISKIVLSVILWMQYTKAFRIRRDSFKKHNRANSADIGLNYASN